MGAVAVRSFSSSDDDGCDGYIALDFPFGGVGCIGCGDSWNTCIQCRLSQVCTSLDVFIVKQTCT